LFLEFFANPRAGEVYNLGGGRENSLSILETIASLDDLGFPLKYRLVDDNRVGDHICYISDLTKIYSHFPNWRKKFNTRQIIEQLVGRSFDRSRLVAQALMT
jgi:CDP-paratose 2-epimerase